MISAPGQWLLFSLSLSLNLIHAFDLCLLPKGNMLFDFC